MSKEMYHFNTGQFYKSLDEATKGIIPFNAFQDQGGEPLRGLRPIIALRAWLPNCPLFLLRPLSIITRNYQSLLNNKFPPLMYPLLRPFRIVVITRQLHCLNASSILARVRGRPQAVVVWGQV